MHQEYIRIVSGAKTAVLFIHGILGTPAHFREFVELVPKEFSVKNVLLDGHGGTMGDFSHTSMEKWQTQIMEEVRMLAAHHRRILIVGHSMGTLLALQAAMAFPQKVQGLFLLASPVRIGVKPSALPALWRVAFCAEEKDTAVSRAMRRGTSVELCKNPFRYLGWIPRFWELLCKSKEIRCRLHEVTTTCRVYQSKRDELVSMRSCKCFAHNPTFCLKVLEESRHIYYTEKDFSFLLTEFEDWLREKHG